MKVIKLSFKRRTNQTEDIFWGHVINSIKKNAVKENSCSAYKLEVVLEYSGLKSISRRIEEVSPYLFFSSGRKSA